MKALIHLLFKALPLTVIVWWAAPTHAMSISAARAYSDNDNTRVVFDLGGKPDYSTAYSQDGSVFTIRIRDMDDPKKTPSALQISRSSCIAGLKKNIDKKDVRYIFSVKKCSKPKAFVLAPQANYSQYRVVIDFPSSEGKEGSVVAVSSGGKSLQEQERDLFISLSTPDSNGLRSMTAAQAEQYRQKLQALRTDYKKKRQEAAKLTAASAKESSKDVEELVGEVSAPPVPVQATAIKRPFVITIDPGHGGKDPGAIGKRGVKEKNVTLAISSALVKYINSDKNFRGYMTRSADRFIELNTRSAIARKQKADLLISIHADSVASKSSTARGVSVWVLSANRANRENGKILKNNAQGKLIGGAGEIMEQSEGNPYLATAILDMSSSNSRSEGYLLGSEILAKLGGFTHLNKKTPIHASLAVLKSPDIPSLLIETGFLSNRYEEIQLNQPNYQKQIAYRIYLGIKAYYEKYPAKNIASRIASAQRSQGGKTQGGSTVVVKSGDTLSAIASRHGTTVDAIKKSNSLKTDTVFVGQKLKMP